MSPDFPFCDGLRFLVDDDQFHVHTVVCRRKPAAPDGGTPGVATGFTLTTAGGLPVVYLPDTGRFRIPILGCFADRRV
jgi:hypothetical protein